MFIYWLILLTPKNVYVRESDQCLIGELELRGKTENGDRAEAGLIDTTRWFDGDTEPE